MFKDYLWQPPTVHFNNSILSGDSREHGRSCYVRAGPCRSRSTRGWDHPSRRGHGNTASLRRNLYPNNKSITRNEMSSWNCCVTCVAVSRFINLSITSEQVGILLLYTIWYLCSKMGKLCRLYGQIAIANIFFHCSYSMTTSALRYLHIWTFL